jgi:hypothetical protein
MQHEVTGETYLHITGAKNLDSITGLSVEESRDKLEELVLRGLGGAPAADQLGRLDPTTLLTVGRTRFNPAFVLSHTSSPGDFVCWDNRLVWHSTAPVAGYGEGSRDMWLLAHGVDESSYSSISSVRKSAPGEGAAATTGKVRAWREHHPLATDSSSA